MDIKYHQVIQKYMEDHPAAIAFPEIQAQLDSYKPKLDYYTPALEDLRIGYQCEIKPGNTKLDWVKGQLRYESGHDGPGVYNLNPFWYIFKAIPSASVFNYPIKIWLNSNLSIRTPYLTEEQIEAEGWIKTGDREFIKKNYKVTFANDKNYDNTTRILLRFWSAAIKETMFLGDCPSINEFRTICKLLNIK